MSGSRLTVVRDVPSLRREMARFRAGGRTVGMVPTMGALHEGHLSLVRAAQRDCGATVTTLFVNPGQFAPTEDLDAYPRDEAADVAELERVGTDLLFAPDVSAMYPDGFATSVRVAGISECLCGAVRPHFFGGVATVVAKLLLQGLPDRAYFGDKDYQQLLVIRRMVRDLDIPVEVVGCPTVREADGLAMSSRNAYLRPDERQRAPVLFRTLTAVAGQVADGVPAADAEAWGKAEIAAADFGRIDYLEVRDAETLERLDTAAGRPARVFVAAHLGNARLIDNVPVG